MATNEVLVQKTEQICYFTFMKKSNYDLLFTTVIKALNKIKFTYDYNSIMQYDGTQCQIGSKPVIAYRNQPSKAVRARV